MDRRAVISAGFVSAIGLAAANTASAQTMDATSQATFDTVMAFMGAMGGGDMETMSSLMADDMVWQNEGDKGLPWIGPWNGKDEIFKFLGLFSENFQTTAWENTDAFAFGDTVAVFGKMNAITTKSGMETGPFTFALRAKVAFQFPIEWRDRQVKD